jgi:hypothetical protein
MIITAFFIQGILYSIKIYLNSGAEATDIPNAILIIGPVSDLNFNFISTILLVKNDNNSFFHSRYFVQY